MENRVRHLRDFLHEHSLDGVMISKPENRMFFSGFTGSAGLLVVSTTECKLITDFRYIEQATAQAKGYEIIQQGTNPFEAVAQVAGESGIHTLGFESDFTTWDAYTRLAKALPHVQLRDITLDTLRLEKDQEELAHIKKAVQIADQSFAHILTVIKPGMRELDVAVELEYKMRTLGAEKPAFDTIIASGLRGALPHGKASEKIIEIGDMITMDFGAVYRGYHSDITRTVVMGPASTKQQEMYRLVLQAQQTGVKAVKPGRKGKEVDAQARKIIADAGYGHYFGHGLGHGVGLAIHEEPRLSPTGEILLTPNMIVTVEPGVYIPDWGGIRIEDTVMVSATGSKILTASSKQFIELEV